METVGNGLEHPRPQRDGRALMRRGRMRAVMLAGLLAIALVWAAPVAAQQMEADVFVAQAVVAYEEKRYDDALRLLGRALELDPKSADALYYTGLVHVAQGDLAKAVEPLERARVIEPDDEAIRYQLGVSYFGLHQYDQAQPLLERVFGKSPRMDNLGYYVGFMRYRKQEYQGALRAFRAGASSDPNIQQLTSFYTGLTLAALGLPEQAAAGIEESLRAQPASPLTGPAERLRDAIIATREKERRFHADVRLGFFYDDNVAVIPNASGDLLVQSLRERGRSSPGELASVKLDYSFLRTGPWEASATFSFFTTYNNDLPHFNIVDYLGGLTGTYRGALGAVPYQLGLQYSYDYLTLGGDEFVQRHTVAPYLALVENAHNLTSVQLRYQNKQFAHETNIPPEEERDADNWMAGFVHLFRFEGDKHFIKVGYQFDYDDTLGPKRRGLNYEYVGHRPLVGGQYTLPWLGIKLKYDFDVHLRDYQHTDTLFPIDAPGTVRRRDHEFTSVLGAVLPLPWNLSFSLDWQRVWDDSNLAVFSYTRNVVSGTLAWTY